MWKSNSLNKIIIICLLTSLVISLSAIDSANTASIAHIEIPSAAWMLQQRGQFGGTVAAIAVQGNYAYLGQGSRVVVVDITDLAHPVQVGQADPLLKRVHSLVINNGYIYASTYTEINIYDISSPTSPLNVGTHHRRGELALSEGKLYVTAEDGLYILDLSTPTIPILLGSYPLSGGKWGAFVGNLAYVLEAGKMDILDVSDPAHPLKLGAYSGFASSIYEVAISGNFALVTGFDGVYSLNISDPANPQKVTQYSTGNYFIGITVSGNYVYVGDYDDFYVMELGIDGYLNPLGQMTATVHNPGEIVVDNQHVFVSGQSSSLSGRMSILDVSQPTAPKLLSDYIGLIPSFLKVSNGEAYFIDSGKFQVMSITDPSAPELRGSYGSYFSFYGVTDLEIRGDYAYLAANTNPAGLHILDVSNPDLIQEVGVYTTTSGITGVEIAGDYAFLTESGYGLRTLNISDPANPTVTGGMSLSNISSIGVFSDCAYLSDGYNLLVVSITNPSAPVLAGSYNISSTTGGSSIKMAAAGNYIYYISGWGNVLYILDVSIPSAITQAGSFPLAPMARCLTLSGNEVYVCNTHAWGGLRIIDVSDAANPTENLKYQTPGWQNDIAVDRDMIYVNDGYNGLLVLEVISHNAQRVFLPLVNR